MGNLLLGRRQEDAEEDSNGRPIFLRLIISQLKVRRPLKLVDPPCLEYCTSVRYAAKPLDLDILRCLYDIFLSLRTVP